MHVPLSLATTLLAVSSLASAHYTHHHIQNEGPYPPVSRGPKRRWESPFFHPLANRSDAPQTVAVESSKMTLGGAPSNAIPRHYNLTLQPDFENLRFNGSVVIELDIVEDSDSIFFHARNLTLKDWAMALTFENGTGQQRSGPSEVKMNETETGVIFSCSEALLAGSKVNMSIGFEGVVFGAEEAFGLFENPYKREDGSVGKFLLTQLEMDGARRIFPCLDDPSLKANFTVSLISAESHTFLSNMDIDTVSKVGDNKKVTFNTSPFMSTYLLALAIGELNFIESGDFRVPIRIYGSPVRNADMAKYALDIAVEGMKKFEEALGIEYALPKIDHVAVEGSAFGGMENWGLITLAQDMVFIENNSTPDTRQVTAEIVLHELAHMWFGDLVTMEWWTQVWLNEGFADYFTYWALKASYPELDMTSQMPQWLRQGAMQADSFSNAHPLEIPINTTDLSKPAIFDTISYQKGASLLRMIDAYMGEDNFMEGLRRYLSTNKYGNTVTIDLWDALGDGVGEMWDPWTKNPGHPVVYVDETENSIIIEQHRFRWGGNVTEAEDTAVFPIPLLLRKAGGIETTAVFKERKSTIELGDTDFFFLNADSAGFYRVAYTSGRLRKLSAQADKLTPADRLGLVHDTMAVASTGRLSVVDGLDLIAAFMGTDEDYWVWTTMLESGVATAAALWMHDDEIYKGFCKFIQSQTSLLVQRLSWPADYWNMRNKEVDDRLTRFRSQIFKHAGLAGDEAAVRAAREMIARFPEEGESTIDPNILEATIWIAIRYGGKEEYDLVVSAYKATAADNLGAQALLLRSLGRTTNEAMLERTLNLILDDTVLPPLKPFIMEGVASSGIGIRVALKWVQDRWPDIMSAGVPPAEIITKLVAKMTKREDIDMLGSWMMEPARAQYFEAVQPAVALALVTTEWAERDLESVKGWLAKDGNASVS